MRLGGFASGNATPAIKQSRFMPSCSISRVLDMPNQGKFTTVENIYKADKWCDQAKESSEIPEEREYKRFCSQNQISLSFQIENNKHACPGSVTALIWCSRKTVCAGVSILVTQMLIFWKCCLILGFGQHPECNFALQHHPSGCQRQWSIVVAAVADYLLAHSGCPRTVQWTVGHPSWWRALRITPAVRQGCKRWHEQDMLISLCHCVSHEPHSRNWPGMNSTRAKETALIWRIISWNVSFPSVPLFFCRVLRKQRTATNGNASRFCRSCKEQNEDFHFAFPGES